MAEPGAELAATSSLPGRRHLQPRGHAVARPRRDIGTRLDEAGLAEVGGVRINISGCTNSCGQHHISDIGFSGSSAARHGKSAPGYQMLLGGTSATWRSSSARRRPSCRRSRGRRRRAGRRPVRRRAQRGETFPTGSPLRRCGRVGTSSRTRPLPHARKRRRTSSVDFDETGPFSGEVGDSECAT
jgi:hypothetical protein